MAAIRATDVEVTRECNEQIFAAAFGNGLMALEDPSFDGWRLIREKDFERYPLPLSEISGKPDGCKPPSAELVRDLVTSSIMQISEVDWVESSGLISLHLFGIADTLRE